jgi:hypothetical protein
MVTGSIMVLHFDLLTERAGQPAAFDGEAVIALQAGEGGAAVSAVAPLCDDRQPGERQA